MDQHKRRETLAYIFCRDAEFFGPKHKPYFRLRVGRDQILRLLEQFDAISAPQERRWFTMTATHENLRRLRLTEKRTPNYELVAAQFAVRGDILKVWGPNSINIDFSCLAASLMADRLKSALERARDFVEIVAPNRHNKPNLLEFIPDVDRPAQTHEHVKLALVSEALAAESLAIEDFSDWESDRGED